MCKHFHAYAGFIGHFILHHFYIYFFKVPFCFESLRGATTLVRSLPTRKNEKKRRKKKKKTEKKTPATKQKLEEKKTKLARDVFHTIATHFVDVVTGTGCWPQNKNKEEKHTYKNTTKNKNDPMPQAARATKKMVLYLTHSSDVHN